MSVCTCGHGWAVAPWTRTAVVRRRGSLPPRLACLLPRCFWAAHVASVTAATERGQPPRLAELGVLLRRRVSE